MLNQYVKSLASNVKKPLSIACAIQLISAIPSVIPFIAIAELGFYFTNSQYWLNPYLIAIIAVISMVISVALRTISLLISHDADLQWQLSIRMKIAHHISQVPLSWFTERGSGTIKKLIYDDINAMHVLIGHLYLDIASCIGWQVVILFYLFICNAYVALISFIPCILLLAIYRFSCAKKNDIKEYNNRLSKLNNTIVDFIRGIPVIKAFSNNTDTFNQYDKANSDFINFFWDWVRKVITLNALSQTVCSSVFPLFFVITSGAILSSYSIISPIDILPGMLLAPILTMSFESLIGSRYQVIMAHDAARRIYDILQTPLLNIDNSIECKKYDIEFHDISFTYNNPQNNQYALSNINLKIQEGELTAIIGPSGSGKSTIAKLLMRFWDPSIGNIAMGGIPLKNIKNIYKKIGFVLQDVQLIQGTIKDNIILGKKNTPINYVIKAAKLAQIHDRIMKLSNGYDTVLNKDVQLSHGENQRIAIARAFILNPPIIILDEPTSSIDPDTEHLIYKAIAELIKDRTVLMITHHLDKIKNADNIYVLDNGKIIESGKHEELMHIKGYYHDKYNKIINAVSNKQ